MSGSLLGIERQGALAAGGLAADLREWTQRRVQLFGVGGGKVYLVVFAVQGEGVGFISAAKTRQHKSRRLGSPLSVRLGSLAAAAG